ncbi:hypothetical protein Ancab_021445 [Ancistrocladus abbreviatus]
MKNEMDTRGKQGRLKLNLHVDRVHEIAILKSSELVAIGFVSGGREPCLLLVHISTGLKCLRLACCYLISDEVFTEVTTKLSLLEEVELTLCSFTVEEIKAVGRNCPLLKTFKLNHQGARDHSFADDEEALAISETMPQLHHLQLIGNGLTTTGLEAIINSCLHLKSVDLCACFHISLGGTLWKRCVEQIKDFRLPNGPTDFYKFVASTDYESDFDDGMFNDVEFLSDIDEYNESLTMRSLRNIIFGMINDVNIWSFSLGEELRLYLQLFENVSRTYLLLILLLYEARTRLAEVPCSIGHQHLPTSDMCLTHLEHVSDTPRTRVRHTSDRVHFFFVGHACQTHLLTVSDTHQRNPF